MPLLLEAMNDGARRFGVLLRELGRLQLPVDAAVDVRASQDVQIRTELHRRIDTALERRRARLGLRRNDAPAVHRLPGQTSRFHQTSQTGERRGRPSDAPSPPDPELAHDRAVSNTLADPPAAQTARPSRISVLVSQARGNAIANVLAPTLQPPSGEASPRLVQQPTLEEHDRHLLLLQRARRYTRPPLPTHHAQDAPFTEAPPYSLDGHSSYNPIGPPSPGSVQLREMEEARSGHARPFTPAVTPRAGPSVNGEGTRMAASERPHRRR